MQIAQAEEERPNPRVTPARLDCVLLSGGFGECVHPKVVQALRISGLIPRDFPEEGDENLFLGQKRGRGNWQKPNPALAFENYIRNINPQTGFIQTRLSPARNLGAAAGGFTGRVYGNILGCLPGKMKRTLARAWPSVGWNGLIDLDLKHCHPWLLREYLSRDPEIVPGQYAALSFVVDQREATYGAVCQTYGVERKDAKNLVLRMFYGGSTAGWYAEMRSKMTNAAVGLNVMPDAVKNIERELKQHIEYLKKKNPELWDNTRRAENAKAQRTGIGANVLGSFLSKWASSKETEVMCVVVDALLTQTTACNYKDRNVVCYEFDGVKLVRDSVEAFLATRGWRLPQLLEWMSDVVYTALHIRVIFEDKPIEDYYDITPFLNAPENVVDMSQLDEFLFELGNPSVSEGLAFSSHGGVADFVVNHRHRGEFIYHTDKWYCWHPEELKWICSPHFNRPVFLLDRAILDVVRYLHDRRDAILAALGLPIGDAVLAFTDTDWIQSYAMYPKDLLKPKLDKLFSLAKATQKNLASDGFHRGVVSMSRTLAHVANLRFNENPLLLGFPNGCFDFGSEEPTFRPYAKEDYISMSCGVQYAEEAAERTEVFLRILRKIFRDEEMLEYVLMVCSTGLLGVPVEHFYVFNGGGRNGKGLLNETMAELLGVDPETGYCCPSFSPSLLCSNMEPNKPYPELRDLERKRYVIAKEPPTGKQLNNSTVRAITGGQGITARRLHENTAPVNIDATWIMECNERPKFAEAPKMADTKRIFDVGFDSTFVETAGDVNEEQGIFLADPTLKAPSFKREMAVALFHLLVPRAKRFIRDGYKIVNVPAEVRRRTMEYVKQSYEVLNAFKMLYFDDASVAEALVSFDDVLRNIKRSEFWNDYSKSERGYFKKDVFTANFTEVVRLEYGTQRIHTARNQRTQQLAYSVRGFSLLNVEQVD